MKKKKIRWAIVGLGLQGEKIATAIDASRHGCIAAVVSHDKNHAQKFSQRHGGAIAHASYKILLKDPTIDAVAICSANHEHALQAMLALRADKHILCEKPMTLSLRDANALVREAKKRHAVFGVGFHLRHHPLMKRVRAMIESGTLGKIRLIEMNWSVGQHGEATLPPLNRFMQWRENPKKAGGGAIMARGIHLFDLLRFLTGNEVTGVQAITNGTKTKTDTMAAGVFQLDQTMATVVTSRIVPHAVNDIILYGSHGRIILHDALRPDGGGVLEWWNGKTAKIYKGKKENLYQKEIDDICEQIMGKSGTTASVHDGAMSVAMTEAFLTSARMKKLMPVT